jgi:peptide/nickel transport system ATP-binding protein
MITAHPHSPNAHPPLLQVKNLSVDYRSRSGDPPMRAVKNVSFDIGKGEVFGLAGESGCGKSTAAMSIAWMIRPPGIISAGEILFEERDILKFTQQEVLAYRWKKVAVVFQAAMNALNPVITVGTQIMDTILAHEAVSRREARDRAARLLETVGISTNRIDDYAHQFSGGMRQRLVIAIALALRPQLLILDEPTTALDVIVQREILQEILELKKQFGFSVLFITHDLALMISFCDRIGVMLAGEILENAPAEKILTQPEHPYTRMLRDSFPTLREQILHRKETASPFISQDPDSQAGTSDSQNKTPDPTDHAGEQR